MAGHDAGLRIVRLANFVMPSSGGLRTALRCLGEGYAAAGHEPVLVVPGPAASDELTSQGRVITVPGPVVPDTGGYRVLINRTRLVRLLDRLAPDRLEVSDRFTLRWTGAWAKNAGVPSVMVSHESLAGLLGVWKLLGVRSLPEWPRDRVADWFNARTAAAYDQVVCTTAWAAAEFHRIGAPNVVQVPLGVDLAQFHPGRYSAALRARYVRPDEALIVHCSRLSVEKRPEIAVRALGKLREAGVPAVLVVVGDGPRRESIAAEVARIPAAADGSAPVHLAGFVPDRDHVAALLASADVALAPGPVETFGLAALEALASGTPVVVNSASALPEVVGRAGIAAPGAPEAFAGAVRRLLARPDQARRLAARSRAEQYGWPAAVEGFLRAHHAAIARGAPVPLAVPSGVTWP